MKVIGVLFVALLNISNLFAHESDREIQMKTVNDELTKRVAELLDENAKLKAHVADIVKQKREAIDKTKIVVEGCNPQDIYEQFMLNYTKGIRDDFLDPWLKKNGKKCTKNDFRIIEKKFIPAMYYTSRSKELIRYFKSTR